MIVSNRFRFDLTCFASSLLYISIGRTPTSLDELYKVRQIEDVVSNNMQNSIIILTIEKCMQVNRFTEVCTLVQTILIIKRDTIFARQLR